ncbi:MAG: imidazoleglycerol-phosphate dehydratase HisB [Candidatus Marinamargulisbacteria bacterium]|jgi:imidazoleglycerol-phosphate dehydratase|nr:imidazoleglycerol-phosphate dehydratase [bacterium]MDG2265124.1 imidazoleglycerol-phosphate dehydratase HisB [Candidatus Marinamargulisbacteria bacterium]|tara:strand:+ start:4111 stop:4707 length:597 start_codon:yes stop_codon:yes gene_type:complete
MTPSRFGHIERKTAETQITGSINLDGTGQLALTTDCGFFGHMLTLFTAHSLYDIELVIQGDLHIDSHHTVEDTGIVLGQAIKQALGDCRGIYRYSSASIPMDESLCTLSIDISNRAFLHYQIPRIASKVGDFDTELVEEFLRAFVLHAGITLHVDVVRGTNTHHVCESIFKALGRVLSQATRIDPYRGAQIPSTKGSL